MDNKSLILAKALQCKSDNQKKVLDHLRSIKDLFALNSAYFATLSADERRRGLPIAFKPTVEVDSVGSAFE